METHDDLLAMAGQSLQEEMLNELSNIVSSSQTITTNGSDGTVFTTSPFLTGTTSTSTYVGGLDPYRRIGSTTPGPIGINGSSGIPGWPGTNFIGFLDVLKSTDIKREDVVEVLGKLLELVSQVQNPSEYDENALKHIKYAKAYLEKALLDKINQHIDGDSKPD